MTDLSALQARFLDYLRYADDAIETDIAGGSADARAARLSIYYNAYRMRLRGSIETDHPVLGRYLGDDGFEQMAAAYIDAHPSSETSLRYFCDSLPEFLRRQTPFSEIAVLSDLAAFERLLMEVFDAADAAVVDDSFLTLMPAERWPALVLQFHPSVRCHVSDWNSVEIWRAIKSEQDPPAATQGDKTAWLLWRGRERLTEFRPVSVDEYTLLTHALRGDNFASLCQDLLEWHTEADVAMRALAILREWVRAGMIVEDDCRG